MGACLSCIDASGQSKHSRAVKGPAQHDSARSVHKHAESGSHASDKQQGAKEQRSKQDQQAGMQKPNKKGKKVANTDLATGEVIPDFGVHGVFDVLYELGSGGSGRTFLCRDMENGKVVAVKFVPRPLAKSAIPFMMAEVEIQAELGEGCLNLISMHEIVLTKTHLALVLEYASGGSLTQEVSCLWESALQRGGMFMEEQEASYYLRQFINALAYCHQHKVAHRDLKLDNTLLEHCIVGPPRIKICDFGFAKRWTNANATMHTAIGTPVYMSPQMLAARQCASGYSGLKADMWAAGVLMFVMLLGTFPFDHDANQDPNSAEAANEVWIKQQQIGWRRNPRAADVLRRGVLSPDCCDLLDKLLEMNEEKRVTTMEVLQHPWLHIPLKPEQQDAWQRLQDEQGEIDRQLQAARDPRATKMRKDAMFAMMAIAAKPPGPTLIPGLGGTHSGGSSFVRSETTVSAAVSDSADSSVSSVPPAAAAGPSNGLMMSSASSPESAPPAAATAGSPAGPAAQSAFTASAATPLAYDDDDAPFTADAGPSKLRDDAQHLSFIEGEGMRTGSLEQKVEAYRQQAEFIRAARMAAAMTSVDEQSAASAAAAAANGNGAGSAQHPSRHSSNARTSLTGQQQADVVATTDGSKASKQGFFNRSGKGAGGSSNSLGNTAAAAAGATNSSTSSNVKQQQSSRKLQSASSTKGSASAAADVDSDSDEEDVVDEVWRLPLTSTADPSLFKLTPELSVAAGALIRQLQGSGHKVQGRGRASRGSCPMY